MSYELYKGLYVRPKTWDKGVVAEQKSYEPLGIEEGDVVLDIGANIGAFMKFAFDHGADHVTGYEPDPDNFDLLEHNVFSCMADKKAYIHRAAVVNDEVSAKYDQIEFYVNEEGTNKALHSTVPVRGRPHFLVPTVRFVEAVNAQFGLAPYNVLKIDIEGGEYDLELGLIPREIKKLAIELHIAKAEFRAYAEMTHEIIEELGFKPVKPFRMTPRGRATLMIYHR